MGIRHAFLLLSLAATPPALANSLPEHLVLEYDLARNGATIGEVSRTLARQGEHRYAHTSWTRATGLSRLLSKTEWRERGEFVVAGTQALPLRFSETRTGDQRAYEHQVTFEQGRLRFGDGRSQPLALPALDQGSALCALMLDPPGKSGERLLAVTDGKDVDTYTFLYQGHERLETTLGELDTVVIRRVKPAQRDEETRCRAQRSSPAECPMDDLTFWLAPDRGNLPVRIERRRKDETTTLTLRRAHGFK